ncbi:MAG: hypothetical protein MO852_03955 [Candidatus Devosia euplotis]|nr:hypothetical protein [Candidatus Devosia euplotis]
MLRTTLKGAVTALLLSAIPLTNVTAEELVVYHGWSTPAEVGALDVLKDALESKGVTWKGLAIPHNSGVNVSLVNMATGSNLPNAFVESNPGVYRDMAGIGPGLDMTEIYAREGVTENLAPIVRELSTVDGKMVKVPVAPISTAWSIGTSRSPPKPASIRPPGPMSRKCWPISTPYAPPVLFRLPSAVRPSRLAI